MTDRLTLTRAFEGAGLKSSDAERIATEIYDAIHDNVATKQDLQALEAATKQDLQALAAKLELVKHQLLTRLGGLIVVVAGLLFAALHHWPPHG
jgi:flagellar motility protein MotE (MotC chaperone)